MSYIAYLNGFNLWLESNALEPVSQLLYFRLLNVFNRAGWPESVQVDNQRIMSMTGQHSEKSAIAARDRLISVRLISYQRGKKGSPGRYALLPFPCIKYSENNTVENIHCISGQFPVSYPGGNREVNPAPPLQPYKDKEEDAYEEGFPPNPPQGEWEKRPSRLFRPGKRESLTPILTAFGGRIRANRPKARRGRRSQRRGRKPRWKLCLPLWRSRKRRGTGRKRAGSTSRNPRHG